MKEIVDLLIAKSIFADQEVYELIKSIAKYQTNSQKHYGTFQRTLYKSYLFGIMSPIIDYLSPTSETPVDIYNPVDMSDARHLSAREIEALRESGGMSTYRPMSWGRSAGVGSGGGGGASSAGGGASSAYSAGGGASSTGVGSSSASSVGGGAYSAAAGGGAYSAYSAGGGWGAAAAKGGGALQIRGAWKTPKIKSTTVTIRREPLTRGKRSRSTSSKSRN